MPESSAESIEERVRTAIAAGEVRRVLELLAQTYLDMVFRYCFRTLRGDVGRARDVTQQVFEEVCKGIATFRAEASTKTWLLAIARNQCLKEIAARERRRDLLREHQMTVATQAHVDPGQGSDAMVLSQEGLARLEWALGQLEPEARSMLVMRFGVGVSYELSTAEIAKILGLSRAGAYRKLQEALARLKRMMCDDAG